jgi:hypothetical protein
LVLVRIDLSQTKPRQPLIFAHCHRPDAVERERRRNLRLLIVVTATA